MDEKTPKGAQAPIPAETTFEDELRAAYEELEAARRKLEEIKAKHPASFDASESPEGANDAAAGTKGDASAPSVGPAQPDGAFPREEAEAASGTTLGEGFRPYEPGASAFAAQGTASTQQNESWQQACAAAQVESASNAGQGPQQQPYGAQSSWQQQAPTGQANGAGQDCSHQQQAGQRPDGAQQTWQMPGQQAWCGGQPGAASYQTWRQSQPGNGQQAWQASGQQAWQPSGQQAWRPYQQPCYSSQVVRTKDHVAAGLLGIFLGFFGIHKFYLGYYSTGFIMLAVTIVGSLLTLGLAGGVMTLIGIIEGIIYLVKSQTDFEQLYVFNKREWF